MRINLLSLFMSLFIITSCGQKIFDEKNKDQKTNTTEPQGNTTEEVKPKVEEKPKYTETYEDFEKDFIITVKESETPYYYNINMNWTRFINPKILRVKIGQNISESTTEIGFFSMKMDHNQKVIFNIEILDLSKRLEYSFERVVEVPKDLVVDINNRTLTQPQLTKAGNFYKYNRIFLNADFSLVIPVQEAILNVNHLIVDPRKVNTIENVDISGVQDYRAPTSQKGKNGNNLQINIKNLNGKIRVINRGQNGGHGINGALFENRAGSGSPAKAGAADPTCGGPDRHSDNKKIITERFCGCMSDGTPGGRGTDGENGKAGTDGGDGGKSGTINLKVENLIRSEAHSEVDGVQISPREYIQILLIPGKKGNRGIGR